MKKVTFLLLLAFSLSLATGALALCQQSRGQTVIVPASYNDVSVGQTEIILCRLIIRNIDREKSMTLTSVGFYSPQGAWVKEFLTSPVIIGPLASVTYLASGATLGGIPPYNMNGGRPSFIVKWESTASMCAPSISVAHFIMHQYSETVWGEEAESSSLGIVLEEK